MLLPHPRASRPFCAFVLKALFVLIGYHPIFHQEKQLQPHESPAKEKTLSSGLYSLGAVDLSLGCLKIDIEQREECTGSGLMTTDN